jgi:hypothetical protein
LNSLSGGRTKTAVVPATLALDDISKWDAALMALTLYPRLTIVNYGYRKVTKVLNGSSR